MEKIRIIAAAIILTLYIGYIIYRFGVLGSLSESYYRLQRAYKKGWIFSAVLVVVVALVLPSWLDLADGHTFQFLGFLAPASLLFVAAAPRFRESLTDAVHYVAAVVAALCSILWVLLINKDLPLFLVLAVICTALFFYRRYNFYFKKKGVWVKQSTIVFWLEILAFYSLFISLISN